MNGLYLWLAGIISGMLGAMGLGGGGVLILYLVFIENMGQFKAQGINLIFFIPCAAIAIIIYSFKKQIKFKKLLPVILFGIPGALLGIYVSSLIGTDLIAKLFGGGIALMGVKEIFSKGKKS